MSGKVTEKSLIEAMDQGMTAAQGAMKLTKETESDQRHNKIADAGSKLIFVREGLQKLSGELKSAKLNSLAYRAVVLEIGVNLAETVGEIKALSIQGLPSEEMTVLTASEKTLEALEKMILAPKEDPFSERSINEMRASQKALMALKGKFEQLRTGEGRKDLKDIEQKTARKIEKYDGKVTEASNVIKERAQENIKHIDQLLVLFDTMLALDPLLKEIVAFSPKDLGKKGLSELNLSKREFQKLQALVDKLPSETIKTLQRKKIDEILKEINSAIEAKKKPFVDLEKKLRNAKDLSELAKLVGAQYNDFLDFKKGDIDTNKKQLDKQREEAILLLSLSEERKGKLPEDLREVLESGLADLRSSKLTELDISIALGRIADQIKKDIKHYEKVSAPGENITAILENLKHMQQKMDVIRDARFELLNARSVLLGQFGELSAFLSITGGVPYDSKKYFSLEDQKALDFGFENGWIDVINNPKNKDNLISLQVRAKVRNINSPRITQPLSDRLREAK